MRIILPGDLEKAKKVFEAPKVFTCNVCNCIFEATNEEYKFEDFCRNEYLYTCECPTCKRKVMLYE